ncbi:ABC-three component system middle component 1 [Flavobacterium sp.]|uniref:ABC-three component system middle component 1 n=1 Tax=Flavobacterium sp. TaxID=239 RepID=UPI00286CD663|nr:ABC-three component system middle component 1 [Flavobacterium sp.]
MKYYKAEIQQSILSILEGVNIIQYVIENDKWKISVFLSLFEDEGTLNKSWIDISSTISSAFQGNLIGKGNEFEKWNIYILYICKNDVEKGLKNRIENDKFSSRKIVEDNLKEILTDEVIEKLIIKHITNTDLKELLEITVVNPELTYIPVNQDIWKDIPKEILDNRTKNNDNSKLLLKKLKTI